MTHHLFLVRHHRRIHRPVLPTVQKMTMTKTNDKYEKGTSVCTILNQGSTDHPVLNHKLFVHFCPFCFGLPNRKILLSQPCFQNKENATNNFILFFLFFLTHKRKFQRFGYNTFKRKVESESHTV